MLGWQAIYAHARNLEKKGMWAEAASYYERILLSDGSNAKAAFRLGHAYFRLDRLDDALPLLERAVALIPDVAAWQYRLGFVLERRKSYSDALEHYRIALNLDPEQAPWRRRIAVCEAALSQENLDRLKKKKAATWQLIESLQDGLAWHLDDPSWREELGDCLFKMGRFVDAKDAYTESLRLSPANSVLHFKEGWALQEAGDQVSAHASFLRAVAADNRLGAKELGPGVFFESQGRWGLAAKSYEKTISHGHPSAELYYRLGVARQKAYDWAGGAEALQSGIQRDPSLDKLYWRLGLSYERLGELQKAETAYSRALGSGLPASRYWKYRLGWVLQLQEKYREAAVAYFLSHEETALPHAKVEDVDPFIGAELARSLELSKRSQSPAALRTLATYAYQLGCDHIAAAAYAASIERSAEFDTRQYFELGRTLMRMGRFRDSCTAFAEMRQFKRPHGVNITPYMKNKTRKQVMVYTEYLETLDIKTETILYESSHGAGAAGNPLQICREIIRDSRFSNYRHVWVLNNLDEIPSEFQGRSDFIFVPRESDGYLRYLATAEYLVNDNTFPPYFIRREEQRYLNTWHGTPIKTLGKDIPGSTMDHKNAARNFLHATHIIAPNKFTADCLIEKYGVAGIYSGKLAITGYPRVDATIGSTGREPDSIRADLGIPQDKKIVLYAPTWRGTLADRSLNEEQLFSDIRALSSNDWHFLYRGHAMTSDRVTENDLLARHQVPSTIDTNDLLSIVDVLITDYSSIFFDFVPTGRPIIYYAYDLAAYQVDRGLYFKLEDMPGSVCHTIDGVIKNVETALSSSSSDYLDSNSEKLSRVMSDLCPIDDGLSSARVVDFFFFDAQEYLVANKQERKRNMLMFQGSFLPNGITSSYLNLVSAIDETDNNVFLVVDPAAVASDPARMEKFAHNPDHVSVLARVGSHAMTPEEQWVVDKLNSQHRLDSDDMWELVRRAFAREFRRMFGSAQFDSIVCFEGYARFWVNLFGSAAQTEAKKSIYLHNDMHREWHERFEYLESNFRMYKSFDCLVSVTKSVDQANQANLAERFKINQTLFTYSNNLVNPSQTLSLAAEVLDEDIAEWLKGASRVFVTMGRLSPEKGHGKLIQAFARVVENEPKAKLVILGEGPLFEPLTDLIAQSGLTNSVLLAGNRSNPFPTLRYADCFVFSSEYEGQGLAVLEALILGKPVISTDVVGPRSVLEGGYGLLVENSIDGLVDGFRSYLNGDYSFAHFDVELYQKSALETFYSAAVQKPQNDQNAG